MSVVSENKLPFVDLTAQRKEKLRGFTTGEEIIVDTARRIGGTMLLLLLKYFIGIGANKYC